MCGSEAVPGHRDASPEIEGSGSESIVREAVRGLTERGETVATAESLTGGAVGAQLCTVPGASAAFRGGVIAYDHVVKASVLGVDAALLERAGAVDPEVAAAMAAGARRVCGTDWGLSTTGVAGPDPHDGKPVGTVFVGICGPGIAEVMSLSLVGDREQIRSQSTAAAVRALRDQVRERDERP